MSKFVCFEGVDFSGKSTQVKLLSSYMMLNRIDHITTREPGGTEFSEKIRDLLNDKYELEEMEKCFLFLTARSKHVKDTIIPALKDNKIVLCDRYIYSTQAYQNKFLKTLNVNTYYELLNLPTHGVVPDVIFYFTLSNDQILERLKSERVDNLDKNFLTRIDEIKEIYSQLFPQKNGTLISSYNNKKIRYYTLDANKERHALTDELVNILKKEKII